MMPFSTGADRLWRAAVVMILMLCVSCGGGDTTEPPAPAQEAGEPQVTQEDVEEEVGEAAETTQAYAEQKKAEYQQEIQVRVEALEAQVEEFNQRIEERREELGAEWAETRENLADKRDVVRTQLERLKSSSAYAWRELREGMNAAVRDLADSLERARSRFQEQTGAEEEAAEASPEEQPE